jgi:acetyl esterase
MTLHPEARRFLDTLDPAESWDLDDAQIAAGRLAMRAGSRAATGPALELSEVRDVDAGGVPARVYNPGGDHPRPVVVHVHGGGWVFGDLETHDGLCRILAAGTGAVVVAVDYRLAPEHPHPAAVQDVEAAVAWMRSGGLGAAADARRVAILGDSAGGNLAAVVARRNRDAGLPPYAAQVLVYPITAPRPIGPTWGAYGEGHGLDTDEMAFYWSAFVPDAARRTDADVSPDRAESLAGLPPALVVTAECDPLRDDGERYAAAMAEAGVEVTCIRYAGMVHGFWRRPAMFTASRSAIDTVRAYLTRMLADAGRLGD